MWSYLRDLVVRRPGLAARHVVVGVLQLIRELLHQHQYDRSVNENFAVVYTVTTLSLSHHLDQLPKHEGLHVEAEDVEHLPVAHLQEPRHLQQ